MPAPTSLPPAGAPFVLLDDARTRGALPARLYRDPLEVVVAHRLDQVAPALERIEHLARTGVHLAGMLAYEAGLALEPRLSRSPVEHAGSLLWFGAFAQCREIAPCAVPALFPDAAAAIGPLEPAIGTGAYRARFDRVRSAIEAGDIYQANLTFPLSGSWSGDPLALYAALRGHGAGGHGAIVHDGRDWVLSFSPELLFTLDGDSVTVRPMKGTRPRGRTSDHDAMLRAELAASAKDRAENLMIVDLMRNDLSRVSVPGSVQVEDPFAVETYPTVHQMVSTVRAKLQPGTRAIDVVKALFPCGSVTGAPKIRAMEVIREVERSPRGPYCGSIGRIDPSGDAAFNVAIRTLRLTSQGSAVLGVGSAVVSDSQALAEWRECLVKGGFVRQSQQGAGQRAAARFDLIETMRFTPEDGIPLLDAHLERVRTSAEELGFSFDRHAVRNAIQALCFDAERPSRLRLVAARSGTFSLELTDMPEALPEPLTAAVLPLPVDEGDWRLRHKTTDRGFYQAGLAAAKAAGAQEALFLRDDGLVSEGCFTNLFLQRDGTLLTPPARLGLLPGVLRRSLIEAGHAREAELTLDDLADGFLVGNALRGLMPARLLT